MWFMVCVNDSSMNRQQHLCKVKSLIHFGWADSDLQSCHLSGVKYTTGYGDVKSMTVVSLSSQKFISLMRHFHQQSLSENLKVG